METLEERRHRMDMAQVYKIVTGKDKVKSDTWFTMAREGQRKTRGNAHPLSLKKQRARIEVGRNFFSQRAVDGWNNILVTRRTCSQVLIIPPPCRYRQKIIQA